MTKHLTDRNKDSIMDFRDMKYISTYTRYPDMQIIGPQIEVYTEKRWSPSRVLEERFIFYFKRIYFGE